MNPKIKELAKQAGINIPDDTEYNGHVYRKSIEKLAQLIVQECCDLVREIDAMEIREHFGVEE